MNHFVIIICLLVFISLSTLFLHAYLNEEPGKRVWQYLYYALCLLAIVFIILFYVGVNSFIGGVK